MTTEAEPMETFSGDEDFSLLSDEELVEFESKLATCSVLKWFYKEQGLNLRKLC